MKQLYTYVFRSEFSEIIKFNDGDYRLLCYDITKAKEAQIMERFKGILVQTNSVEVPDNDPLQGISWFSADFSEEDLDLISHYTRKEERWTNRASI